LLNRETPTEHLVNEGLTQSYRDYAAHLDVLLILGNKIIAVAEALGLMTGPIAISSSLIRPNATSISKRSGKKRQKEAILTGTGSGIIEVSAVVRRTKCLESTAGGSGSSSDSSN